MILAGDIGGTKTLLALYDSSLNCIRKQQVVSAEFKTFELLLADFLGDETIKRVSIGVAGPVINGECNTTNLPWVLRASQIKQQTNSKTSVLLNDLEATAWGVLSLPADDFIHLNTSENSKQGNLAILAAGTGLGEAIIHWDGNNHQVIANEGGHCDFAPTTEKEILLLQYLMKKYPEHVSYERLVSGEGLVNIYHFFKNLYPAKINLETEKKMIHEDSAAIISQRAMARVDSLCVRALNLFCRLYGAESGNLALKCLPYGGVVLAGGIVAKILPALQSGLFMDGFLAKGRYKSLLEQIPVKVCLNSEAALFGAAYYAHSRE
ncbi:MAG: glucokinase [Methylococcales bacterium]|nr:glucokinase [Methylococcales bacterium]